jgi:hypothetical protein
MPPEARERSFDELASGLASGSISRGKALRLMGAALVGGVLASIPGIAGAAPNPNRTKCDPKLCPSGCKCARRLDRLGRACITCSLIGCFAPTSCEDCPPGTICVPGSTIHLGRNRVVCGNPCPVT